MPTPLFGCALSVSSANNTVVCIHPETANQKLPPSEGGLQSISNHSPTNSADCKLAKAVKLSGTANSLSEPQLLAISWPTNPKSCWYM